MLGYKNLKEQEKQKTPKRTLERFIGTASYSSSLLNKNCQSLWLFYIPQFYYTKS